MVAEYFRFIHSPQYMIFSLRTELDICLTVYPYGEKKNTHTQKKTKKKQQMATYFLCKPNFTIVWANSADDNLMIFFLFFPANRDSTFHANCLHWGQSA